MYIIQALPLVRRAKMWSYKGLRACGYGALDRRKPPLVHSFREGEPVVTGGSLICCQQSVLRKQITHSTQRQDTLAPECSHKPKSRLTYIQPGCCPMIRYLISYINVPYYIAVHYKMFAWNLGAPHQPSCPTGYQGTKEISIESNYLLNSHLPHYLVDWLDSRCTGLPVK